MEKLFRPCQGKSACREDAQGCLTCGRSHQEIAETRELVESLGRLALAHGYSNIDEFAAYVAARVVRKVAHARQDGGK